MIRLGIVRWVCSVVKRLCWSYSLEIVEQWIFFQVYGWARTVKVSHLPEQLLHILLQKYLFPQNVISYLKLWRTTCSFKMKSNGIFPQKYQLAFNKDTECFVMKTWEQIRNSLLYRINEFWPYWQFYLLVFYSWFHTFVRTYLSWKSAVTQQCHVFFWERTSVNPSN